MEWLLPKGRKGKRAIDARAGRHFNKRQSR